MSDNTLLQQFITVMKPSYGGGFLTVMLGALVTVIIMTPLFNDQFNLEQYTDYAEGQSPALTQRIEDTSTAINSSSFLGDVSVFIAWSITGVLGYLAITSMVQIVKRSVESIDTVEHAPVDKKSAERELVEKVLLRAGALLLLYGYYLFGISTVLPSLTVLGQYSLSSGAMGTILGVVAVTILASIAVHIAVVLVRLILLRTRIFFKSY